MKNIFFQITPSLHSMSILEHATKAVSEKKGGALINALWSLDKRVYMGDVVAKRVLGMLLEKASIPYMEMLSSWLQTGLLRDPYAEFMVKRSTESNTRPQAAELDGDAWMALFSINEEQILEVAVSNEWTKQKILTTGKYWNAVHACHVDFKKLQGSSDNRKIPKLPFNSDSSAIAAYIDSMYQSASRVLVRLMMENFKLMDSLQVMKRFFLLDQGDFLMHFLDASEDELVKQSEDVSIGRIQHWLSMSVQLTESHREEPGLFPEGLGQQTACQLIPSSLRCRLSNESLVSYLDSLYGGIVDHGPTTPSRHAYGVSNKGNTGIEVFQIDFPRIPFPISLALSQQAMGNYKLLFRHMFFTKHVERRLIGVWRDHQVLKKLDSLRGLLGPTFLLRQRMLHFVQNLIYYMTFEVIENNWMEMQSSIDQSGGDHMRPPSQKQQTVDDILTVHNEFLYKTLEACLLTNRDLIRSLTKLMNTCLLFTDQMNRFMDTTKIVSFKSQQQSAWPPVFF
jgi:gamma-tubulin complex component 2